MLFRISDRTPDIPTDAAGRRPEPCQAGAGILPRLGHSHFHALSSSSFTNASTIRRHVI
jgi:hypothetical protein